MKVIFVLLISLLAGCADYSTEENLLFGTMIIGQTADYYTTQRHLDSGGRELNPIVPKDNVLLFKAGVIGTCWILGEIFPEHRKLLFLSATITGGGAAIYNSGI